MLADALLSVPVFGSLFLVFFCGKLLLNLFRLCCCSAAGTNTKKEAGGSKTSGGNSCAGFIEFVLFLCGWAIFCTGIALCVRVFSVKWPEFEDVDDPM